MTSLRTFQSEIDQIHHRELAKQRAQAAADRAKADKDSSSKKAAGKASHARKESTDAADASKGSNVGNEPIASGDGDASTLSDIDERLQVRGSPMRVALLRLPFEVRLEPLTSMMCTFRRYSSRDYLRTSRRPGISSPHYSRATAASTSSE